MTQKIQTKFSSQEDEDEIARRKMKAEEVDVDVMSELSGETDQTSTINIFAQSCDDEIRWADEGIDHEEQTKPWRMKVLMDDGDD